MRTLKKTAVVVLIGLLMVGMALPLMASAGKVNINTAEKEELVTLKHIGDKLADRIIEHRTNHPFEKPEDIMEVKGVGEKVFEANKDHIIVKE